MQLYHLAPLLGIVEEISELHSAQKDEDVEDAIADICIYMCDFCGRFGIDMPHPDELTSEDPLELDLSIRVGDLCHHVLKTHQGIRGYDDHAFAIKSVILSVAKLRFSLEVFACEAELNTPDYYANKIFVTKICKRDWVESPQGNEHA